MGERHRRRNFAQADLNEAGRRRTLRMNRPVLEVADLVRAAGDAFIERSRKWIRCKHVKVVLAIARCGTAALGGQFDECTGGGHRTTISYNSCRD